MGVRCTCPLSQLTHQRCVAPQLWDYESGGFERTLKGHTNAVQWVTFDKAGGFLGTRQPDASRRHPRALLAHTHPYPWVCTSQRPAPLI